MSANIKDIAEASGYSIATISRALRGDPKVRSTTREKILAHCEALNYEPSMGGRLLKSGLNAVVGLSLGIPYLAL